MAPVRNGAQQRAADCVHHDYKNSYHPPSACRSGHGEKTLRAFPHGCFIYYIIIIIPIEQRRRLRSPQYKPAAGERLQAPGPMVRLQGFQPEGGLQKPIPSAGVRAGPCCPRFAFANESSLWLASQPFISPPGSVLQTKVGGVGGVGWQFLLQELEGESLSSLSEKAGSGQEPPPPSFPAQAGLSRLPSAQRSKSSPGDMNRSLAPPLGLKPITPFPFPSICQGLSLGSKVEPGVRQRSKSQPQHEAATSPLASSPSAKWTRGRTWAGWWTRSEDLREQQFTPQGA